MAPVHDAARRNDVKALRALLDAHPELLEEEEEGGGGLTPLHHACDAGSLEAVQLLLDRGADINKRDRRGGEPPIMAACSRGRAKVVRLLLARGADPSLRSHHTSFTTLIAALMGQGEHGSGHIKVLRLLLKHGRVPVDARDFCGRTALCWTCRCGNTEGARLLLVEGRADHTIPDFGGTTPMAITQGWRGHRSCAPLLEWYEAELERAVLLGKARAVADARECISKAAEKVGARTEAEAQRAREEAAPAFLRGRVSRGEALPVVEVVKEVGKAALQRREKEHVAVYDFVVHELKDDLVVEMVQGLGLPLGGKEVQWVSEREAEPLLS